MADAKTKAAPKAAAKKAAVKKAPAKAKKAPAKKKPAAKTKAKASTKAYGFRTTKIPLSKNSDQPLAPMAQPLPLAAATIF